MRATQYLGAMPSFWRRSLDHMKRQTNIAITMQGLTTPENTYPLVQFGAPGIIDQCKAMSDKGIGGFSTSDLTYHAGNTPVLNLGQHAITIQEELAAAAQDSNLEPPHMLWQGRISTELPRNNPQIQRTGFAGWRTRDMGYSLFGKVLWDLGQYNYLTLRFKSDGRKYFVNIQTDSLVATDLHQHILPTSNAGAWEVVTIPFGAFVRTNHGLVVEPQNEMNRMKVRSVGIGLTDRIQGPYELRVAEIFASNSSGRGYRRRDSGFGLKEDVPEVKAPTRKKPEKPEEILI